MNKTEKDLRFQKTEEGIINAMLALLGEKTFEEISVKDICEKANISRSGFYLHYMDKYDLVESYQKRLIGKGMSHLEETLSHGKKAALLQMLGLMTNEGKMLAMLLSKHGSRDIQEQVKTMFKENARRNLLPHIRMKLESDTEVRYLISFISNAMFGVLQEWIDSGQKESPEELGALLDKFIPFDLQ